MDWQRIIPVGISIGVLIAVTVLREYSKPLSAITATMPLNLALAMWIVYSGEKGNRAALLQFNGELLLHVWQPVLFVFSCWLAARAGWSFPAVLIAGYVTWALAVVVILGLRMAITH